MSTGGGGGTGDRPSLAVLGEQLVGRVRADPRLAHTADVVVVQGGVTLMQERLLPGSLRNVRSVTTSVLALLVGATLGPEVPTAEVVERPDVTLHDLLSMQRGAVCSFDDVDELELVPGGWRAVIEAMPHDAAPGTVFRYDNLAYELVASWLSDRLGESLEAAAARSLLGPLGIGDWSWPTDPDGYHRGSGELALTAPGLARLGQVVLDRGTVDGREVVPPSWVGRMCTPHAAGGSPEPQRYGYGVWVDEHVVRMAGWAGQSVTVVPALDAVVVLTGRDDRLADGWVPAHLVLDELLAPLLEP